MSEFFEVRNEFYKDTQGAILVYDVTNRKSFEALDNWVQEATKFGAKDVVVVVCGNKIDKVEKKKAVSDKEAKDWCSKYGFMYVKIGVTVNFH